MMNKQTQITEVNQRSLIHGELYSVTLPTRDQNLLFLGNNTTRIQLKRHITYSVLLLLVLVLCLIVDRETFVNGSHSNLLVNLTINLNCVVAGNLGNFFQQRARKQKFLLRTLGDKALENATIRYLMCV